MTALDVGVHGEVTRSPATARVQDEHVGFASEPV